MLVIKKNPGVFLATIAVLALFAQQSVSQQTCLASVYAGNKVADFAGDLGPATDASFKNPNTLWMDTVKKLYLAETLNYRVRLISASKIVTTFAGFTFLSHISLMR